LGDEPKKIKKGVKGNAIRKNAVRDVYCAFSMIDERESADRCCREAIDETNKSKDGYLIKHSKLLFSRRSSAPFKSLLCGDGGVSQDQELVYPVLLVLRMSHSLWTVSYGELMELSSGTAIAQ